MEQAEIARIHAEHWRVGYGSVTPDEMDYFQDLIARHRPRSFLEVGTASGLSGGLIALLLNEYGGERLVTIDHDNSFFGDRSKENGFLLPKIYPGGGVQVDFRPFTTATAMAASGEQFDMAFVDANHQHPWPLMDTLCLYPAMRGPKVMLHHDLDLYRKQDEVIGIGPKYLYDQFPHTHRDRSTANHGNLFSVSLDFPVEEMERIARDAFALPWSLRTKLFARRLDAFRQVLRAHYSTELLEVFEDCRRKFNVSHKPQTA